MPTLYVAGVSISSNPKDISPVTLKKIKNADVIIGEERKIALRLLNVAEKSADCLYLLNEHSKDTDRQEILDVLLKSNTAVLFSDSGTPCISDPDFTFIDMCRKKGITIKSLAGASSITAAISVSGLDAKRFFFAGFPPKDKKERQIFFKEIFSYPYMAIFMERPYTLETTLRELLVFKRKIFLSINLGSDEEMNLFDFPEKLIEETKAIKAPFIVIIPKNKNNKKIIIKK